MRRLIIGLGVLALATGCGPRDWEELEFYVNVGVEDRPDVRAAWSPVRFYAASLWQRRTGVEDGDEVDETTVVRRLEADEIDGLFIGPDGQEVALVPDPDHALLWHPEQELAPGEWRLEVSAMAEHEGEALADVADPVEFQVTDAGLADRLDLDDLDGAVFHDGTLGWGPSEAPRLVATVAEPLGLSLHRVEDGWEAAFYAPSGQEGFEACRVWRGPVEVSDTGLVSTELDEITVGEGLPVRFTDVRMRLGVEADGRIVRGLELDTTFDARPLDPSFSPAEGLVVPGAAADFFERYGIPPLPCEDGELQCFRFESHDGDLVRATPEEAAEILESPPCLGAQPGQGDVDLDLTCSTLGTAGVGVWLFGVGALLVRRRRRLDG